MTAQYFSDPAGNRQERIIPFQKFNENYLDILYNPAFPDILTVTEKKLLQVLNKYAFMDGKCYPKQTTLAGELNCTPRQIRRLTKSLEEKKFIEIERSTLIERHLFKQSSYYFFLWHPAYEMVMSSEMSGEKTNHTINYINQQVLKAPAEPTGFENLCNQINQYHTRFNPAAFIGKYIKLFPADAVKEALQALLKKLSSGVDKCFEVWGYAVAIIKRIGPNYNEAESIKEAQQFKEKLPTFEELEAIMFESQIAEDDVEVQEPESQEPVPTSEELRAMLYEKKEEPKPVKEEKIDINQICNQINQHETKFNPSTFIEHHVRKYTTDTIAEVLQKILEKMDMAADVDKILLFKFDFWKYGSELINQMKIKDHDKLEQKRIREELSQQKRIPEHKSWWKGQAWGARIV